jgi:hypothetical protein
VRQPFSFIAAGSMPVRRRADFLVRRAPRQVESCEEETLCVSHFRSLLRAACPRAGAYETSLARVEAKPCSFVSKGSHGVDLGSSSGRNEDGNHTDACEKGQRRE